MLDFLVNMLDYLQAWVKTIVTKLGEFLQWKEETEEKLSSVYAEEEEE